MPSDTQLIDRVFGLQPLKLPTEPEDVNSSESRREVRDGEPARDPESDR